MLSNLSKFTFAPIGSKRNFAARPHVYFDSSAASHVVYMDKVIEKIRENVGIDRLLYGSDYPIVEGSTMKYEVNNNKKLRKLDK